MLLVICSIAVCGTTLRVVLTPNASLVFAITAFCSLAIKVVVLVLLANIRAIALPINLSGESTPISFILSLPVPVRTAPKAASKDFFAFLLMSSISVSNALVGSSWVAMLSYNIPKLSKSISILSLRIF